MLAFMPNGGPKSCNDGCVGFGSCVKACPFDAIHVVNGVAVVDKEACKACGKCVAACPKHLKCTGCGTCKEKCPKKVIV